MKILVDADACPVKEIIVRHAKTRNIPVTMVIDTSHFLSDGYSEVITVDKGADSADIKLVNLISKNDIVVTQDYGVAALSLSKKARALSPNGLVFTDRNIDKLLLERHIGKEIRRQGKRMAPIKKRTKENDAEFERQFIKLLDNKE